LQLRLKSDPAKLQMAARLRAETTLPIHWIAQRLHLGTWKSANARIHAWKKSQTKRKAANAMV
jgi:L-ascorbate metabolism protein UlaG (beta-lactamase superfamily)